MITKPLSASKFAFALVLPSALAFVSPSLLISSLLMLGSAFVLLHDRFTKRPGLCGLDPAVFTIVLFSVTYPLQSFFVSIVDSYRPFTNVGDEAFCKPALDLANLSLMSLLLGYQVGFLVNAPIRRATGIVRNRERQHSFARSLSAAFVVCGSANIYLSGGVSGVYLEISNQLKQADSIAMVLRLGTEIGASGVFALVAFRDRFSWTSTDRTLLTLAALLQLFTIVGSGAKWPIVVAVLCLALAFDFRMRFLVGRRDIPRNLLIGLIVSSVLVAVAFPVIAEFRMLSKLDPIFMDSRVGVVERLSRQLEYFRDAVVNVVILSDQSGGAVSGQIGERTSSLSSLSRVISYLDENGSQTSSWSTLLSIPVSAFIPRSIWAEKSTGFDSGDFASLNGWSSGGLSLTLPGTLYWYGGTIAVVAGFLFFGIVIGYLWKVVGSTNGDLSVSLCFIVAITLMMWEPPWDAIIVTGIRYWVALSLTWSISARFASSTNSKVTTVLERNTMLSRH